MGTAAGTAGTVSGVPGNMPDALLLDEMFSPAIATDLAARGIDCRAVVADPVLRALSDLEIFQTALAEGRVLVTNNVPDFESLRRAHEAAGNEVPGLIYTSDLTFPRTKAYVSRLGAALAAAAGRDTARCGGVLWLRPPVCTPGMAEALVRPVLPDSR
jgi:hypothetical protein